MTKNVATTLIVSLIILATLFVFITKSQFSVSSSSSSSSVSSLTSKSNQNDDLIKTEERTNREKNQQPLHLHPRTLQETVAILHKRQYPKFVENSHPFNSSSPVSLCRFREYRIVENQASIIISDEDNEKTTNDYNHNDDDDLYQLPLVKVLRKKKKKTRAVRFEMQNSITAIPRVSPADVEEESLHEHHDRRNVARRRKRSWTWFRDKPSSKSETKSSLPSPPPKKKNRLLAILLFGEMRKVSVSGKAQFNQWVLPNNLNMKTSDVDVFAATWPMPYDEDFSRSNTNSNSKSESPSSDDHHLSSSPAEYVASVLSSIFHPTVAAVRVDSFNPRMFLQSVFGATLTRGGNSAPMLYLQEAVARLAAVQFYDRTGVSYDFFIRSRFDLSPIEPMKLAFVVVDHSEGTPENTQNDQNNSDRGVGARDWYLELGHSDTGQSKLPQNKNDKKTKLSLWDRKNKRRRKRRGLLHRFSKNIDLVVHHNTLCCMNDWIAVGQFSSLIVSSSVYSLASLRSVNGMMYRRKRLERKSRQQKGKDVFSSSSSSSSSLPSSTSVDLITAPSGRLVYNWWLSNKEKMNAVNISTPNLIVQYNDKVCEQMKSLPVEEFSSMMMMKPSSRSFLFEENDNISVLTTNTDDSVITMTRQLMYLHEIEHQKSDSSGDEFNNNIIYQNCYAETCIAEAFVDSRIQWRIADLRVTLGNPSVEHHHQLGMSDTEKLELQRQLQQEEDRMEKQQRQQDEDSTKNYSDDSQQQVRVPNNSSLTTQDEAVRTRSSRSSKSISRKHDGKSSSSSLQEDFFATLRRSVGGKHCMAKKCLYSLDTRR